MRIDLHGYHIHIAWKHFNTCVTEAYFGGVKKCTVITGQGAMMHEFQTWARKHPRVKECTQTPNNPGSFSIILYKRG
jgi:DNA-nicking Smr family endonuclease